MDSNRRNTSLTDAEIRAIIDDTERQALGGWVGAIARAGLGTLAFTVAVFAAADFRTVGLVLLCGVFILGLAAYIRFVARSVSMKPRISARPAQPVTAPPTASPETTPVTPASPETTSVTPAIPAAAFGGIAGGSWSRLSQNHKA